MNKQLFKNKYFVGIMCTLFCLLGIITLFRFTYQTSALAETSNLTVMYK